MDRYRRALLNSITLSLVVMKKNPFFGFSKDKGVQSFLVSAPNIVLIVGILAFIAGVISKIEGVAVERNVPEATASVLRERNLAIEEARKAGRKDYGFSTNFIPGIGRIADPEAYKQQALQPAE